MADIDYEKTNVLGREGVMGNAAADGSNDRTLIPNSPLGSSPQMADMPTVPVERTLRPDAGSSQTDDVLASLAGKRVFSLKGDDYVEKVCLSDSSGEGQVFLVERGGLEYVLKVYYPNFDVNRKLMQVVRSFDFEMVVKVFDFGRTYVEGVSRYYELMEYLRGGTMKDIKLNGDFNRFRRLALQAAGALAYCHQNHLLHKDVKPTNYFFRDKEQQQLVLGDFGISAIQEGEGESFRTTQARTPIYAAPEMYTDVIDGEVEITYASDFYSLGITLFALWLGENPMSSNERTMMRQKSEGRLPRLVELPEQVKRLVQGLTAVNQQNRWGYDEVERWFKGENVDVDISSPFLRYKSFIVDPERNLIAANVSELVPMLLANPSLAMNYLYNGRIVQWLEASGNVKLASIIKDLVTNRYPADQKAGLMAACYAMEPSLPYTDVQGAECDNVHAVSLSLLSYPEKYAILLKNPNDPLFLWMECRLKCDVERLRSYFAEDNDGRIGVLRIIYEIDRDVSFLSRFPSASLSEIVHSYGYCEVSEDDWRALCDGRLLSWLYSHEDVTVCEALRIMTNGQAPSRSLGYKVLYNMDRSVGYDLREAVTPESIGQMLADDLVREQNTSGQELTESMKDYTDADGRFAYYAELHGWTDLLALARQCFDLKSEENHERLGAYDLRTALYRFTRILGVVPTYLLPGGVQLADGRSLDQKLLPAIKSEIRNGGFLQWMSVFYHEDPTHDFSEEYSYERELEQWVLDLGKLDPQQIYFKRYTKASEDAKERVRDVRRLWKTNIMKERMWKYVFLGCAAAWIVAVFVLGLDDRSYLFDHHIMTMILPLGGMSGIIVAVRAYFKGYGAFISMLFGAVGVASSLIPYYILRYVDGNYPDFFQYVVALLSVVYIIIALLTDFSKDQHTDTKFIENVLNTQDIRSTLIDPLYYTFKTRSQRYKASNFGLLDEVADHTHSLSGETIIHYILWTLTAIVLIAELCLFSPKVVGWKSSKQAPAETITIQEQGDVE